MQEYFTLFYFLVKDSFYEQFYTLTYASIFFEVTPSVSHWIRSIDSIKTSPS